MAIFVSGRGSNLQALLDQEGCNIRLVCSHGLEIPADLKTKRNFIPLLKSKKINFLDWQLFLRARKMSQIFLLGFMRLIPADFIKSWPNQILNIHPSLLPLFPGLSAIEKSFQERMKMGVTVHRVIPQMDAGDKVLQSMVFEAAQAPQDYKIASFVMTFREHFLVRKVGEKWN